MADTNIYTALSSTRKVVSKAEFDAMDKSTIPVGTEYDIVAPIEKADLSTELQTEIDGKLTAPTTPTADSAVTMLSDGTIGTKPLSEIGGGGKLYRHHILGGFANERASIQVDIIKKFGMPMTENDFKTYVSTTTVGAFTGMNGQGAVNISYDTSSNKYSIQGAVLNTQDTGTGYFVNLSKDTIDSFTDTVTEL